MLACGSRSGLGVAPQSTDAAVAVAPDATLAPFPCRWGLGEPTRLSDEPFDRFEAVVDETKVSLVIADGLGWLKRDRDVIGPRPMGGGTTASLVPGGFLRVSEACEGERWLADFDRSSVETSPVPLVAGDACRVGRGDREAFPIVVRRLGRTQVVRVPRVLDAFGRLGDVSVPYEAIDELVLVDEQLYVVVRGALVWQSVVGEARAVELPGVVRDVAADLVGGGVVALLEDRAVFVARGEVGRTVELPPTFPHVAVSDQEALVMGTDGALITVPLPRGPHRVVDRIEGAPDDAIVTLADGHAVGGVASREAGAIVWRALTCNR